MGTAWVECRKLSVTDIREENSFLDKAKSDGGVAVTTVIAVYKLRDCRYLGKIARYHGSEIIFSYLLLFLQAGKWYNTFRRHCGQHVSMDDYWCGDTSLKWWLWSSMHWNSLEGECLGTVILLHLWCVALIARRCRTTLIYILPYTLAQQRAALQFFPVATGVWLPFCRQMCLSAEALLRSFQCQRLCHSQIHISRSCQLLCRHQVISSCSNESRSRQELICQLHAPSVFRVVQATSGYLFKSDMPRMSTCSFPLQKSNQRRSVFAEYFRRTCRGPIAAGVSLCLASISAGSWARCHINNI